MTGEKNPTNQTPAEPQALSAAWTCEWCGSPLVPFDGVWIDEANRSGDFCPEGRAVGATGTSPHLPVLAAAHPQDPPEPNAVDQAYNDPIDGYEAFLSRQPEPPR